MSYGRSRLHDDGPVAQIGDRCAAAAVYPSHPLASLAEARRELASLKSINAQLVRQVATLRRREAAALRLAERDGLTGLYNRRTLSGWLDSALDAASQHDDRVGLLLLDLDGFKAVNDRFGHSMGDKLLCQVATRLAGRARGADRVCRYGGDEFIVVLPRIDGVRDVTQAADSLAKRVSAPYDIDGVALQVTASIGVAVFPDQARSAGELIKVADRAMYAAKAEVACAPAGRPRASLPARRRGDTDLRLARA